jgi:hypothetical protein
MPVLSYLFRLGFPFLVVYIKNPRA